MTGAGQASRLVGRFFYGEFGGRHYTHIYAVEPVDGGNIKFGRATNVKSRFSGIQTGSPVKLRLLGSALLPVEVELAIHQHLEADHSHGEWFLPTGATRKVADLLASGQTRELVELLGLYKLLPNAFVDRISFDERMNAPNGR